MPSSPSREDEQPRRRRKEPKDERGSTSSKEHKHRTQHKSSSGKTYKRRSRSRERDRDLPKVSTSERGSMSRKVSGVVPEMDRIPSGEDRPKTSYPSFSKAHSREAVNSREDVYRTKGAPYTPEATELGQEKSKEKKQRRRSMPSESAAPGRAPPSPPLTANTADFKRPRSGSSMRKTAEDAKSDLESGRKSTDGAPRSSARQASKSTSSLRKEARLPQSDISSMPGSFPEDERRSTPTSGFQRTASTSSSQPGSTLTQDTQGTGTDSDATSVAPERKGAPRQADGTPPQDHSPSSTTDSQPKTPIAQEQPYPFRTRTPIDVASANAYTPQVSFNVNPKTPVTAVPPPPPPPPPPLVTGSQPAPRVDYLLKNGGLSSMVPRRLVHTAPVVQQYAMYQSPSVTQNAPIEEYAKIFTPVHKRLDDYLHVLRHNGSLAVATGYKSVARRLLDKLSQVFARDISSQRCDCVICKTSPQPALSDEEDSGFSWGEILEFVSGRRELPQWPPFTITPDDNGLGIKGATHKPMQKLDIDVPEEYKDHYIRQNQKTKKAVQSWLSQQPEFPSSPPEDADEDTLMFAMMTKLDAPQRNIFIALMHGQNDVPTSRAPTPAERPSTSSDALRRARKALQRLYRLDKPPRDCESAMYLLNNPPLHGMLATLAEVNESEWEILISGRFDGFLWSGAEAPFPPSVSAYNSPIASRGPSRGPNAPPFSRNTTPFSGMSGFQPSRGSTPFSPLRNAMSPDGTPQQNYPPPQSVFPSRGPTPAMPGMSVSGVTAPPPVQMDEDTEIAVLAEVERNLFNDMERFEDAFEILHSRAELVRQLLRERSAGLSMQAQSRRGSEASAIGVRLDTPASGVTDFEDETDDDGLADMASLAPDDSASQISTSRRHRKRHERRTPAPVAEEDESTFEEHIAGPTPPPVATTPGRHWGGRRSKH
ncbi:uncharacterized protein LTR77_002037 [Saxophila tyrrhenica]|uniref:Uncharacterized protein n=1 Tax=Saxophila tyrrhenica TaxID=1690608 RepID=A0AAV9PM97_9PEZI|nr:hypothetical protein LTR77_002037 [Saxophila tyrrhenica]